MRERRSTTGRRVSAGDAERNREDGDKDDARRRGEVAVMPVGIF
jgi:hypothetical protein